MLVAVASPFHGYKDAFNDPWYNKLKAEEIREKYAEKHQPAVVLVLATPGSEQDAVAWCFEIIRHCDELHLWYPKSHGLSMGMKAEVGLAMSRLIKRRHFPQEVW